MRIPYTNLETVDHIVKVKSINMPEKPCEDCGIPVRDRRVEYRVATSSIGRNHVKVQCKSCNLFKDPETGLFNAERHMVDNYYARKRSSSATNSNTTTDID